MLTMPLLHAHDHSRAARRCQYWLVASVFHCCVMLMYVYKDHNISFGNSWDWILLFRSSGSLLILIVSFWLLIRLVRHYPITEDHLAAGIIIGYGFLSFFVIVFTDLTCLKSTTIIWEIILIPATLYMHTLRFASQGPSTKFELIPFSAAVLGVAPAILCLIPQKQEAGVLEHLMHHLPLNIANFLAAVSRLADVILIWCNTTRETGDYFRSRLQECFL